MRASGALLMAAVALCLAAPLAGAQQQTAQGGLTIQSPVLTIDAERLFEQSAYGRRIIGEVDARGAELAAENRRIEDALGVEEKNLTDLRSTITPAEFRELADAFDEKVQNTRREQDAKARELNNTLEEARVVFLNAAAPVLEQMMREAGAAVVMERRSVFISSNAVDITLTAITRIDSVLAEEGTVPDE